MQKGWIKKGILALIILAIFVVPTSLNIKINNILAQTVDPTINVNNTAFSDSVTIGASIKDLPENFEIVVRIYDKKPNISDPPEIKEFGGFIESKEKKEELNLEKVMSETDPKKIEFQKFSLSFKNLKDNTDYWVIVGVVFQKNEKSTIAYKTVSFKTNSTGQGNTNVDDGSGTKVGTPKSTESFGCSIGLWGDMNLGGCILEGLNYVWKASGFVGELAGKFLDFFVYYATNSSSYSNIFVEKAWSAVRDVANIFFIVALLYIAIKTILSLNVTDNKKLIGYVVIIALVINFSLFTTKVVIDGSNILAKIFYNNIVSKDASATNANGTLKDSEAGTEGQKSISIGLIRIFNPQRVVMDAYNSGIGLGYAIFIILLLIAITLYTAYIFFSVAILFVARVVSLWMSMIFSPLAFASYTVPFDIPGFGHKEWWDDLLKNAFLAPLFTFMLYIIVMFAGFLNDVVKYTDNPNMTANGNGMQHVMSITIPFIILMVLLAKAKTLVEKYSGEMGKAVMKGAQMIGGAVLGAGTGMAAFGLRNTAGRVAANVAQSTWLQEKAAKSKLGAAALKMTSGIGKGSFDVRGIKVAGKDLSSTGLKVNTFGKAQEGGFTKARADSVKKQEEFANKLLDTSDKGKAELTRGGMNTQRAAKIEAQLIQGGMSVAEAAGHRASMEGNGVNIKDLSKVARHLDAAKRETYADRLDKRSWPTTFGTFYGKAERKNAKKRISANKIRKDAGSIQKQQDMAAAMTAWAAAGGGSTPPPPAAGGAAPHP